MWLIVVGVLLRIAEYLANRSLWLDEAMLAETILGRPLRALFEPPLHAQVVPVGFLALEKAAAALFGGSELALRLPSLAAGIASLFLFRRLAARILPPLGARVALALFAVGDALIYFSSELKPYEFDVALGIVLVERALDVEEEPENRRRAAALALTGAVAVWFSFPVVFVLGGVAVTLLPGAWRAKGKPLLQLVGCVAAWVASFAVFWATYLHRVGRETWLIDYWSGAFLPFPPRSLSELAWVPRMLAEFVLNPGSIPIRGIGIFLWLVAAWYLAREQPRRLVLLFSPFAFALVASAFHKYPFVHRLILFLVPFLLIFLAEGAWRTVAATRRSATAIGVLLLVLLVGAPAAVAGFHLFKTREREDTKSALAYVAGHRRPGDRLYVYEYGLSAFDYYAPRYGIDPRDAVRGDWLHDRATAPNEVERLRGSPRTWIVLVHTISPSGDNDEDVFVPVLDEYGKRLDAFRAPGAAVYLYDFRGKEAPSERKEN